ncbi:hypothetical protein [Actinoplanes sp. ATCC 53533]|uniref:hypothetical protein n=1 Tax=Actinoplanes sp. ATCC 53533 TaxID=1288362 RepID=UPI001F164D35|nr:hypothetical protein [Actinoplanes sp. ATCC 53533]
MNFTGQCGFAEVERIHRNALTTVLLVPDRYAQAAHMTSRWFEALLAGCLPLTPTEIRFADAYAPRDLQIDSSQDVIDKVAWLQATAGSPEHADLIAACLPLLEPFRCSAQVSTAITILEGLHDHWARLRHLRRRLSGRARRDPSTAAPLHGHQGQDRHRDPERQLHHP